MKGESVIGMAVLVEVTGMGSSPLRELGAAVPTWRPALSPTRVQDPWCHVQMLSEWRRGAGSDSHLRGGLWGADEYAHLGLLCSCTALRPRGTGTRTPSPRSAPCGLHLPPLSEFLVDFSRGNAGCHADLSRNVPCRVRV